MSIHRIWKLLIYWHSLTKKKRNLGTLTDWQKANISAYQREISVGWHHMDNLSKGDLIEKINHTAQVGQINSPLVVLCNDSWGRGWLCSSVEGRIVLPWIYILWVLQTTTVGAIAFNTSQWDTSANLFLHPKYNMLFIITVTTKCNSRLLCVTNVSQHLSAYTGYDRKS